jgi:hypothetical protein
VISDSLAFNASRHLSTLVSMLELSPPLPVLLLLRVGGLSRLNSSCSQRVRSHGLGASTHTHTRWFAGQG